MIARVIRLVIVTPLFVALVMVALALSPAAFVVALFISIAIRSWRPVRAVAIALLYAIHDVMAVVAGFVIWLRLAGRGRMRGEAMQTRHYRLTGWLLHRLSFFADGLLGIHVVMEGEDGLREMEALERPLLVLSRHAGPGDSFLLANELLARGRRPRIVLRSALKLDPAIDLLGNRLPFCFVTKGGGHSDDASRRIGEMSKGMDDRSALLLFPEGGNFTPERRMQSIRYLLKRRLRRRARQAAEMTHVISPRPGGVLAALDSAPSNTAVIFVAHSGLAGMSSHVWQRLPMDRTLICNFWLVGPESIPPTEQGRIDWLYEWWGRIDDWVGHSPQTSGFSDTIAAHE